VFIFAVVVLFLLSYVSKVFMCLMDKVNKILLLCDLVSCG
jgi:hypothetical protein